MGCWYSRADQSAENHSNIFRVVNIDEACRDLCTGKLEITETDIILYREGRDTTVWPLHTLRRYGFEKKIFSFEAGRRCETGEGIYAFRCQRAGALFQKLQQRIELRNVVHDSLGYPMPQTTPSPTMGHAVVQRRSIDEPSAIADNNLAGFIQNGVPTATNQSPRSPSSNKILEVMALNPNRQSNGNHASNVYHLRNIKKEHNNNQAAENEVQHVYSNDLNRDLAMLRRNLKQEFEFNTMRESEYEARFFEGRYINEGMTSKQKEAVSPTLTENSEHYAELTLEQQQPADIRFYMNIPASQDLASGINSDTAESPSTPLTPKPVDYCNLSLTKQELNTYANLSVGEVADTIKSAKQCFDSNASLCLSPTEELVHYAVLDMDNKEKVLEPREVTSPDNSRNSSRNESTASFNSQSRGRLISQNSYEKPPTPSATTAPPVAVISYTTIDFDKTVALTSVATSADAPRKRLSSSNVAMASPGAADRGKNN